MGGCVAQEEKGAIQPNLKHQQQSMKTINNHFSGRELTLSTSN